jgi:adenylyltransferase/sulfurtransferase
MQSAAALRYLAAGTAAAVLMKIDVWEPRWHVMDLSQSRNPDCPCCARGDFAFLRPRSGQSAVSLCGRDTVQIRPPSDAPAIDLGAMAARLAGVAEVQAGPGAMKCRWRDLPGVSMTLFPDGRALIHGTHDLGRARSIYARFVGN